MPSFKITEGAQTESAPFVPDGGSVSKVGGRNIVSIVVPKEHVVSSFEPGKIKDQKGIRYSDVQKGSAAELAAETKNARFRINNLTRGPLSVEAEERALIEKEVQNQLERRLQSLHEEVRTEAYAEGLEKGRLVAREEVIAAAKPMLAQFEQLIAEFEKQKFELLKANESLFLRIINQLIKSVILKELKEDSDYTKRLVIHLLERLGTRENIRILVGQEDFSSAEKLKQGLAETLGELKNISVELDPIAGSRGCRLETDFGEIDARIEVQLQNIAQTLK